MILLAYVPEQICLKHHLYVCHCTTTVIYISLHITNIHKSKNNKLQLLITIILPYMWSQHIFPSNATYMTHLPFNTSTQETTMYICIPLMNSKMAPGALVYSTAPLLAYAPQQLCLQHEHLVPLQVSISAYTDQISINCNIYLPYYCKICANKKYAPSNATCPNYWSASMGKVYQYICHI